MQMAPGFTAQLSLPKSVGLYKAKARQVDLSLVTPQRVLWGWSIPGEFWLGYPKIFCQNDICRICDSSGCRLMTSNKI
jgi:hypothetical protein